jgi:hypothetical protein
VGKISLIQPMSGWQPEWPSWEAEFGNAVKRRRRHFFHFGRPLYPLETNQVRNSVKFHQTTLFSDCHQNVSDFHRERYFGV